MIVIRLVIDILTTFSESGRVYKVKKQQLERDGRTRVISHQHEPMMKEWTSWVDSDERTLCPLYPMVQIAVSLIVGYGSGWLSIRI
jgi:hypothetical protein